jgi:two-component system chemotaxis response regulator CheB
MRQRPVAEAGDERPPPPPEGQAGPLTMLEPGPDARETEPESDPLPFRLPDTAVDVVAMAASAGGLRALSQVLSGLLPDFPAAILIVQHIAPTRESLMAHILSLRTGLQVKQAEEGDRLRAGTVFIAPPDRHLLIRADGTISLTLTARVHFVRPSADALFESVAAVFQERAVAVVLTGTGSDGAAGIEAIKAQGGTVIVQEEATSEFAGMPHAAIHTGKADLILPLHAIPNALNALITRGASS